MTGYEGDAKYGIQCPLCSHEFPSSEGISNISSITTSANDDIQKDRV